MLNEKTMVLAQLFLKHTFGRRLEENKPFTKSSFLWAMESIGRSFVLFFKQGVYLLSVCAPGQHNWGIPKNGKLILFKNWDEVSYEIL